MYGLLLFITSPERIIVLYWSPTGAWSMERLPMWIARRTAAVASHAAASPWPRFSVQSEAA
eukprot:COSAG04_NODE_5888_length_1464_cov_1.315751_2_plen_60_part_01